MHDTMQPFGPLNSIIGRTDRLSELIEILFKESGHLVTLEHTKRVVQKVAELAEIGNVDIIDIMVAAWLHDVSVCIPQQRWTEVADFFDIDLLPEERQVPLVAHQKISAGIAANYFAIDNQEVLDAIGCHTTLRASATDLDKTLFVADKIAWDQPGTPPYLQDIEQGLRQSIDKAALAYLDYLWWNRATLPVLHPWVQDARIDLRNQRTD